MRIHAKVSLSKYFLCDTASLPLLVTPLACDFMSVPSKKIEQSGEELTATMLSLVKPKINTMEVRKATQLFVS